MNVLKIKTEYLTNEFRTAENNGLRNFTKCEHCGFEFCESSVDIVYRHRHRMALCSRCTDNFDNITPWSVEHEKACGLPPFPVTRKGV